MRILITEFAKAFIYLNRHLLYTNCTEDWTPSSEDLEIVNEGNLAISPEA